MNHQANALAFGQCCHQLMQIHFMTTEEIKNEIQKSLDKIPESVLHDILDF